MIDCSLEDILFYFQSLLGHQMNYLNITRAARFDNSCILMIYGLSIGLTVGNFIIVAGWNNIIYGIKEEAKVTLGVSSFAFVNFLWTGSFSTINMYSQYTLIILNYSICIYIRSYLPLHIFIWELFSSNFIGCLKETNHGCHLFMHTIIRLFLLCFSICNVHKRAEEWIDAKPSHRTMVWIPLHRTIWSQLWIGWTIP